MNLRITDKTKPGGLDGNERINFESRVGNTNTFRIYDISLQEIANLAPSVTEILDIPTSEVNTSLVLNPDGAGGVSWGSGFSGLTDGNGTTANGTAVDLGGVLASNTIFTGSRTVSFGNPPLSPITTFNVYASNSTGITLWGGGDVTTQSYSENALQRTQNSLSWFSAAFEFATFTIDNSGFSFTSDITGAGVFMPLLKSGATQVAAGAAANELWVTASHATLPDGVVMRGL